MYLGWEVERTPGRGLKASSRPREQKMTRDRQTGAVSGVENKTGSRISLWMWAYRSVLSGLPGRENYLGYLLSVV